MKKRLLCMLTVLALLLSLAPAVSAAPDFSGNCSETVAWSLEPATGLLTISGEGAIPDYSYGTCAPWYACRARIFRVVLESGITAIGNYAFYECAHLTEVDASACTLSAIGEGAMVGCPLLTTITFTPADSVTIGKEAFFGCAALKTIDLGAASGEIGSGAFEGCEALSTVTLPLSLKELKANTFSGCTALSAITLPEDLTAIGRSCFRGCIALETVVFPETLTQAEPYAFRGCTKASFRFEGDAPEFAGADTSSATFPAEAVLQINYDAEGWTWPICRGYEAVYSFPGLSDEFRDLNEGAWYIPFVQHVYYLGLMNGLGKGEFAPGSPMTRGQLVTVLYRLAGSPEVESENPFTDVNAGAYYEKAVCWAQANGIVTGITTTTFEPNRQISREQMCTILYRYAALLKLDLTQRSTLADFADTAAVSDYARDPMAWCVEMGFVNGKPGKLLDPKGTATRAEIAKVLTGFHTSVAEREILAQDDWEDEYTEPKPGPDIDREDPLYLYAKEIFGEINKVRTESGLNALEWDDYLFVAAQTRAAELAGENGFSHTRPDGSSYSSVFDQYDIHYSTARNEIIAHGYSDAKSLVDVWTTANSTSPVIHAVVYSTAAVGVYQAPAEKEGEEGKYYYALLVIG